MNGNDVVFVTWPGVLVLFAPALAFTGLALLAGAPAEWGRGALGAYLALLAALVAAHVGLGWGILAVLSLGLLSLITGGLTGLAIATLTMAGLAGLQYVAGPWSVHLLLLPAMAALGLVSLLRHLLF